MLVATALGQQQRLFNVTDSCKQAMKSARRPTGAECALPRNRTDADTDRFCAKVDRCIDASKDIVNKGCANDTSTPFKDMMIKYFIALEFKSKCLKDSNNQYCRTGNQESFCKDCLPKRKELVQQLLANAPQEAKDRALKRQEDTSMCNDVQSGDSKPATSANAMTRSSDGNSLKSSPSLILSVLTALTCSFSIFW
jgi:hypothetical protein